MSTLLIEGGHRLEGRVAVEGNKNAALPILAACLLTDDECVLTNVPRIGDVEVMARLLLDLGAEVDGIGTTTLRIRTPRLTTDSPDRSINHAAGIFTRPSLVAKPGGRSLATDATRSRSASLTTGFMKNDPTLRESGSRASTTMPFDRRILSTASRTTETVGLETFDRLRYAATSA